MPPESQRWTLLIDQARPGWQNMAIDCALLDLADEEGAAFLRLYRWDPYCFSFGRHEPASRRYSRADIEARGLDCVRRPTGGRAVWHARELTYAVAAPLASFGGLQAAYRRIHDMLAVSLGRISAGEFTLAAAARSIGPATAGTCFSAPVGGEVLLDGHKVVGSAQLRQGDAFLQHGSVLLELGRSIEFETAAEAIALTAPEFLATLEPEAELPSGVLERAGHHAERFKDPAWTWER